MKPTTPKEKLEAARKAMSESQTAKEALDKMPKIRKTNVELITDFMELGSPLNELFVIQAMNFMSNYVLAKPEVIRAQMNLSGSSQMINVEAWIKCAADWATAEQERNEV